MLRRLLVTFLLIMPAIGLQAQHQLGLAGSNYGGSRSVLLNPSSIADSRHGFHMNLFMGHLRFANTYFYYDGPGVDTETFLNGESENILEDETLFDRSYIRERLDGKSKMAHFGIDLQLPSFMLKLSPRHSIALTTRFRTALQANNISEDIARVIGYGTANPEIQNIPFAGSEAYFNTNAFAEVGFTYATVLLSQEKRFLKGGITVKKLAGLYSAHLLAPDVDYQLGQTAAGESAMLVEQGKADFGFSRSEFDIEDQDVLDALTWRDTPGTGWGLDIGFTYEHRPDYADYQYTLNGEEKTDQGENKYKYRIGLSLLDVGAITYDDPEQVRRYDITRQNLDLNNDTFEDVDFENLGPTLEEALEVEPGERQTEIKSGLPTALHLNFDYRLSRRLFVNTAVLHSLRAKDAVAMRQFSTLSVAPRFEGRKLELALPVYLTNNYRDLNVGAMLRLGALVVGTDNLAAMLAGSKAVGPDLYMGFGIGIGTGGQRRKLEERAQKKAKEEQKKLEKEQKKLEKEQKKAGKAESGSTPPETPGAAPANLLLNSPEIPTSDSLATIQGSAPAVSMTDATEAIPSDSVGGAVESTSAGSLFNLPILTPADSLMAPATDSVKYRR